MMTIIPENDNDDNNTWSKRKGPWEIHDGDGCA